jgi:hypothetical protein
MVPDIDSLLNAGRDIDASSQLWKNTASCVDITVNVKVSVWS